MFETIFKVNPLHSTDILHSLCHWWMDDD